MTTKYQVFVSSTYEDLISERDQVIKAVLEMGHIPVGMEMFSAADEEQWKIISRHIEESDYYAVILAHRYGSKVGGISYSRKEYEHAVACGVPVLGFVIDGSASWPADRVDKSTEDKALLDDFKTLVKQKPVSSWTSADDLYGKFSVALVKAITANPREGWIRASAAAGPEVTAEMTRLSAENARLRAEIREAKRESEVNREAELSALHARLKSKKRSLSYRTRNGGEWHDSGDLSYSWLFNLLVPTLLSESSVKAAATYIYLHIKKENEPLGGFVAYNWVQDLFADLAAFDLMAPSDKKRSLKDSEEYWTLAPHGRELQKWLRRRNFLSEDADESGEEQIEAERKDLIESKPRGSAPGQRSNTSKKTTAAKKAAK
ncbi:DUF4062 domain-containing protein [Micromonospora wenchangensis]|uniref:DUF4062 domain-containing protein n=1 Tax=Micromonospora wenchangensis TaxID=1185415 RepID=UPI003D74D3EE